jgi:hypothetical protein
LAWIDSAATTFSPPEALRNTGIALLLPDHHLAPLEAPRH